MSRFVQLHLLASYPPSNPNRDDLGRPKTAMMGGEQRLRISSQSLKRAWRTSELFENTLDGHIGTRTKSMGVKIFENLITKGVSKKDALEWAQLIAGKFGDLKTLSATDKKKLKELSAEARDKKELEVLELKQLAHFSPSEQQLINELVDTLAERGSKPEKDELALLRKEHTAADIALFGRMLAGKERAPFVTEAAAQVAHAVSVHPVVVEDDFFTAVDDLNNAEDDMGAGHMGDTEFAAALFYLYICVDKKLLVKNLSGDEELANKALAALIESAATIAPSGKQNSFASRVRASYALCETGDQQPRSLSVAFLESIKAGNMLPKAIKALEDNRKAMDDVYGKCSDQHEAFNTHTGKGNLQAVIQCAVEA